MSEVEIRSENRVAVSPATPDQSKEFYNNWVDYLAKPQLRHQRIFEGLKFCRIGPGVKALDIGCGCGHTSLFLGKSGCEVLAIDFAENLIEYSRKEMSHKNVTYEAADATQLDLGVKFDLIVLADVIEHIYAEHLPGLLRTIYGHSHEETQVYVNVPYPPWQKFAQDFSIGDAQPIDNVMNFASIFNLFESISFVPMHIDIYGIATPVEYVEAVFVRREELYHRWAQHYSDLGVIELDEGGPVPTAEGQGD